MKETPFILSNRPLKTDYKDVFHIDVQIEELNRAVEQANMIGIISEYGGGKSSVVKSFAQKYRKKYSLCDICLWQFEKSDIDSDDKMTPCAQSFLYQLSKMTKKKNFTRNINHIMSRNYRTFSFSTDIGKLHILFLIFLAVLYVGIMLLGDIYAAQEYNVRALITIISTVIYEKTSVLKVTAAILILLFFRNNNISFSLQNKDEKFELTLTDSYDIFERIIHAAGHRKSYIINIEDLDRISDPEEIKNFLKLLYKYNSLLTEDEKKRFIFIVSLSAKTYFETENERLYEKIFDYILLLRPINEEKKEDLITNLLKWANGKLSIDDDTIKFLTEGNNCGIREVKFRLNKARAIFEELSESSSEDEASICFKKSVITAYLESVYPIDMYHFVFDSDPWHSVMSDRPAELENELTKHTEISQEFKQEIIKLFKEELSTDDYWKYFHRSPRESS